MRDDLLDSVKVTDIINFVLSLRDRIRTSVEIVNEMEEKAKTKGKCWYKKARDVTYEVVEQVLLLLPLIGKPLQAKFCGPYTVVKRLGEVDYLISNHDRRKAKWIVHVNLLHKFLTRPSVSQLSPVALVGSSVSVQLPLNLNQNVSAFLKQ